MPNFDGKDRVLYETYRMYSQIKCLLFGLDLITLLKVGNFKISISVSSQNVPDYINKSGS